MTLSAARLEKVSRAAVARLQGHCTERILQNAIAGGLCASGVKCQQEIVLPVLQDDTFVGSNRLDIVVIGKDAPRREVVIVELKTLSGIAQRAQIPKRVLAQCQGYRQCALAFFGADTRVTVYLLNVSVDSGGARTVRAFAVPAPAGPPSARLYEIRQVLRVRAAGRRRQALVWWQGYPKGEASWEPVENLPLRLRKLAAKM